MKYKILFMVFFVFVVLLMTACSTATGVSQWEYFSPEHVKCHPRKEIKMCKQYGPHLICQCAAD